jgi:hypothetical protein
MKTLIAAVMIATLTGSALAQEGHTTGSEAAGQPLNSTVTESSRDPATGRTPGYSARSQSQCKNVSVRHKTASGKVVRKIVRHCS